MNCEKCNLLLSEERKDSILYELAKGLKPEIICEDCIEGFYEEPFEDDIFNPDITE